MAEAYPEIDLSEFSSSSEPTPDSPAALEASPEKSTAEVAAELELLVNGRTIKAPLDHVKQWAQQGYDYNQRNAEFKQQLSAFEQQQAEFNSQFNHYKQVDDWAKNNPDQWQHILNSYQTPESDPTDQKYNQFATELAELKSFRDSILSERESASRQQADQRLGEEITGLRAQYKTLDWDKVDAHGLTLESRVLQHAHQAGIGSFKAAFLDLNSDHLIAHAKAQALEEYQKTHAEKNKLGISQSKQSMKIISPAENVRNKSWSALEQEALDAIMNGDI
jgi:hypothetical protein